MRTITKVLVMSSFLIFLFSHLILLNALDSIYTIKNAEQTYGDMYTIHPDGFIDLVFDNGAPLPLEPAYYHGGSTTLYGSTFFMIARLTNGSDAIVLLEVNFNEEFNQIIDYSISPLPLEKKYYAGLATNGSHFWTLEDGRRADNNYSANYQYLICFSLDKGIISNRTFASIDPLFSHPTGEFERTGLQIRNNTVILLEKFYSRSDNIDSFVNVTFYDLLTMERENSFDAYYSLPIITETSYYAILMSINLDATGILWIERSQPHPVISFISLNPSIDSLTPGYSLDSHTVNATIFEDYHRIKPFFDGYFSSLDYTYQNHTYDYLARMDHERIITQNKVIDCYEALSEIQKKNIIGFRIYSLQKYFISFPVFHLAIWAVSIFFLVTMMVFILYTHYHKELLEPSVISSSSNLLNNDDLLFHEKHDIIEQRIIQSLPPQLLQKVKLSIRFFILTLIVSFLIYLLSLVFPSPLNSVRISSIVNILSICGFGGLIIAVHFFSKNRVGPLFFQGRESVIFMAFSLFGSFLIAICMLVIEFPIPNPNDLFGDLDTILVPFILLYLLDIVLQVLLLFGVLRFTTYLNDINSSIGKKETYSLLGVPILGIVISLFKVIQLYQFLDHSFLGITYSWISAREKTLLIFTSLYPLFPLLILPIQIWIGYKIFCVLNQLETKILAKQTV